MDFWSSLEMVRARNDVLRHPFYERWSAGELTQPELALYAGQYRHAVVALAGACANAAAAVDASEEPCLRAELDAHALEESEHIGLWDSFCEAVGGNPGASASPETKRCSRVWAGDSTRPLVHSLLALYAIEAAQPGIARAKRAGLLAHYGLPEGPATAYFELHEHRDVEHAAAAREVIEERLNTARGGDGPSAREVRAMLDEAERVLIANWGLLDGVERLSSA